MVARYPITHPATVPLNQPPLPRPQPKNSTQIPFEFQMKQAAFLASQLTGQLESWPSIRGGEEYLDDRPCCYLDGWVGWVTRGT